MESVEEYREIEFEGVKLRVYKNGIILKYMRKSKLWKQMGLSNRTGYPVVSINYRTYSLHRLMAMVYLSIDILDLSQEIDHIDRHRTNNNINNLRIVTRSQNQFNRGAKGYSWNKANNKWAAKIGINKQKIHLGYFNTEQEASEAYQNAKKLYHVI